MKAKGPTASHVWRLHRSGAASEPSDQTQQGREARAERQHDLRRLIECGSHHSIADLGHAAVDVGLAGLRFSWRQSEVRTDGSGFRKPPYPLPSDR